MQNSQKKLRKTNRKHQLRHYFFNSSIFRKIEVLVFEISFCVAVGGAFGPEALLVFGKHASQGTYDSYDRKVERSKNKAVEGVTVLMLVEVIGVGLDYIFIKIPLQLFASPNVDAASQRDTHIKSLPPTFGGYKNRTSPIVHPRDLIKQDAQLGIVVAQPQLRRLPNKTRHELQNTVWLTAVETIPSQETAPRKPRIAQQCSQRRNQSHRLGGKYDE